MEEPRTVEIGPLRLKGLLGLPGHAGGLVIFAHGSGSGRLSPRNQHVAAALRRSGFATLLLDLLTPEEENDRSCVFDIPLLAERLAQATDWAAAQAELAALPMGYFGASTGAGAALLAVAWTGGRIKAVVSRGGRPDLAGPALPLVKAPTLLIVGGLDIPVIRLNREAMTHLACPKRMITVSGASHLFEENGTLDEVIRLADQWFGQHLPSGAPALAELDHAELS
jgi:putative phosphoribosyl transferase